MANQIVIAGGQVGSTNWINTEVADNEYPVMGSGIKAAIDAAGGGGFNPMVLNTVYDDLDQVTGLDKSWAEIVAAYNDGQRQFMLLDGGALITISEPYTDDDGVPIGITWEAVVRMTIDDLNNRVEFGGTYVSYDLDGNGDPQFTYDWQFARCATV